MTWRWIRLGEALAIHGEQIAEHGVLDGIRDEGLFESAMARAENLAAWLLDDLFRVGVGVGKEEVFDLTTGCSKRLEQHEGIATVLGGRLKAALALAGGQRGHMKLARLGDQQRQKKR